MAPKKKEEPPQTTPEVEEEVILPEGVDEPPLAPFRLALGHLFGTSLLVQPPMPPLDPEAEPGEEPHIPPPITFDAKATLLEKLKVPITSQADLLARKVAVVDREELQLLAKTPEGEERPLTYALRQRLEKERAARSRAKLNVARRNAIAAAEAAKQAADEAGSQPDGAIENASEPVAPPEKVDFLLISVGYPSNVEELQEIAAEGFCSMDMLDLWTTILLTGSEIIPQEEQEEGAYEDDKTRMVATPEMVLEYYDVIQKAALGSELADCTICTVREVETMAFPDETKGDPFTQLQTAMLDSLSAEVASRIAYRNWMQTAQRVAIPDITVEKGECRLYHQLMSAVDPSHHDVPFFLHCLTEQVERTLEGEPQDHEDDKTTNALLEYLAAAAEDASSKGPSKALPTATEGTTDGLSVQQTREPPKQEDLTVLPYLDHLQSVHYLGEGGAEQDSGGVPLLSAVQKVMDSARTAGVNRNTMPRESLQSQAQREALAHRLYPFAPEVSGVELEQLVLLHSFEELLNRVQPERAGQWCLLERCYREFIPKDLVGQTLQAAARDGAFLATAHIPRYDALIVSMHFRSPGGRVLWHSWRGDLYTELESDRWAEGMFSTPTYNDWAQVFGGKSGKAPQPKTLIEGLDARQLGYAGMFEKLATPPDGSLMLVTKTCTGIESSFPVPSNELAEGEEKEDLDWVERKSAWDDGASSVTATQIVKPPPTPQEVLKGARCDVPPKNCQKLGRILRDGLTFGILVDESYAGWRAREANRRKEAEQARLKRKQDEEAARAAAANQEGTASPDGEMAEVPNDDANERVEEDPILPSPLESLVPGAFWLTTLGGARLSVRLHHERILPPSVAAFESGPQSLDGSGALLTYTMASGQVIQVFGGGTVCLSFPSHLAPSAAWESPPALEATLVKQLFKPGCPEDVEVTRSIPLGGCLCRKLVSGRIEVYQADGTVSTRNPTMEELKANIEEQQRTPGGLARHALEILKRLQMVYDEKYSTPLKAPPTEKQKLDGLPGHWVVIKPNGQAYGRVDASLAEPAPVEVPSSPTTAAAAAEAETQGGEGEGGGEAKVEEAAVPPPPLQELLNGTLIEDGKTLEYEIGLVPAAMQEGLHTRHRTYTNALGLTIYEDAAETQKISLHTDGTQLTRNVAEETGYVYVDVWKECYAHVRCQLAPTGERKTLVHCSDGCVIEVTPENGVGEEGSRVHTLLKDRHGLTIKALPDGVVEVLSKEGSTEADEHYTALLPEGKLVLKNIELDEGTEGEFALTADQQLIIPSPPEFVGLEMPKSPRCATGGVGHGIPDLKIAPAKDVPPPRLFVIYGNGEAEELLEKKDVEPLLEEARAQGEEGSDALRLVEGPPLTGCSSYTIFRQRQPDTCVVPSVPTVAIPENLDSLSWSCYGPWEAASQASLRKVVLPPVVTWRHFVEHPTLSEEVREKFRGSLAQYRAWEAEQLSKFRFAMQGPDTSKGKKDAKGKDKEAKDKKRGRSRGRKGAAASEAQTTEEKPPDPVFVPDLKLTAFEHHVQSLKCRAQKIVNASSEERLEHALKARLPCAEEPEVVEEEQPIPPEAIASYSLKIGGIDFDILKNISDVMAAVTEVVKGILVEEAAKDNFIIAPEDITIALSGGSLVIEANIVAPGNPDDETAQEANAALLACTLHNSQTLPIAIAAALQGVSGIEEAALGRIEPITSQETPGLDLTNPGLAIAGRQLSLHREDSDVGTVTAEVDYRISDGATGVEGVVEGAEGDEANQSSPDASLAKSQTAAPPRPFSYFNSEMGQQFLARLGREGGLYTGPPKTKDPTKSGVPHRQPTPARSPWNPPLVGEEPLDVPKPSTGLPDEEDVEAQRGRPDIPPGQEPGQDYYFLDGPVEQQEYHLPFQPDFRTTAARETTPVGPHPSKKSSKWDHKGYPRPMKAPVSQAYVEINTEYLEVEGPTDRRVRTSSVAHKKNAQQAPSVQSVRKTGVHAAGRGTELSAKDLVGDISEAGAEEHWKRSSTMQGLGDSNNLVAVVPGSCRFGPLCLGKVYRMYFFLRNLDVDTTGYTVSSVDTDFVQICHNPGEIVGDGTKIAGKIAPGMAKRVCVEIAAHTPRDKIEHLIVILVKAHRICVPVTAKILDVEEYEKDDATEMAIHQRHIGRTRERGDSAANNGKPPPVELVTDPVYCQQAFLACDRRLRRKGVVALPPIQGSG